MSGVSSYPRTRGKFVSSEVIRALLAEGLISENDTQGYNTDILTMPPPGGHGLIKEIVQTLLKGRRADAAFLDKVNAGLLEKLTSAAAGDPVPVTAYHHTGARNLIGFKYVRIDYMKKLDRALYKTERNEFDQKERATWLSDIGKNRSPELLAAGISRQDIDRMAITGKAPDGYQVHHRIPLDDGGTNSSTNFILIKDDIEHRALHGYYNPAELRIRLLAAGETAIVAFPVPPEDTLIYPNPSKGYISEPVSYATFLENFDEH